MPMQLSPDGRETLEDALRILVETAGDDAGRAERERKAAALWAELSGHPIMAKVQRGELGAGALLTPERAAELAADARAAELVAEADVTLERELELWRRGDVRQRATRVRELCSEAQRVLANERDRWSVRALELLDELADAAGALLDELKLGERGGESDE